MDWHSARTFRRGARKDRQQPVLYTNCLLQCFVQSIAICLKNSLMITSLTLDGIPLAPKYLRIFGDGLANNRNLRSLSLARCQIDDAGCYTLLESLQCNSSLHVLNLSLCCLRSATCLSLFLKKRKANLLQSVWKKLTLHQDINLTVEEGLRVLILDRNYKFGDIDLRQLTCMLKSDFWLKTLRLRCCGITQHGGEIMLELLQMNSVLTQIDLRDNEVSTDILQIICKLLKNRENKRERISMKKRLLSNKHIFRQDIVSKNDSFQLPKEKIFLKNQVHTQTEMQQDCILQRPIQKIKKTDSRKRRLYNEVKKNWIKVDELRNQLSIMIEHNQNLITYLENSTNFLMKEKNRHLSTEEAYHKIQPRLRNLKNKIAIQNPIHLNMCYENQVYTKLQNIFDELKISTNGKILKINDKSPDEKISENRIKSIVYHKNQSLKNEITVFS